MGYVFLPLWGYTYIKRGLSKCKSKFSLHLLALHLLQPGGDGARRRGNADGLVRRNSNNLDLFPLPRRMSCPCSCKETTDKNRTFRPVISNRVNTLPTPPPVDAAVASPFHVGGQKKKRKGDVEANQTSLSIKSISSLHPPLFAPSLLVARPPELAVQ